VIDISIIIVSWNTKKYLEECLNSLRTISGNLSTEIIVVDNASADGTPEMVRTQFPDVKLIESGANLGFAKGNNLGIQKATGRYLCLINSDVNVPPDCLSTMHSYMEQQPTIGVTGPAMLRTDGKVHRSGMRFPTLWTVALRALYLDSIFDGVKFFGGFLMKDFRFDRITDIEVLDGWFWMVRREALIQVGTLDERFFMYAEDVDWCKRFHMARWRVVFYPTARALHYCGASSANAPSRFTVEMQRANLQYWKKYHGRVSLLLYLFINCLGYTIRAAAWALIFTVKRSSNTLAGTRVKQYIRCLRWALNSKVIYEACVAD